MTFAVDAKSVEKLALLVLNNAEGMHLHHDVIRRSAPSEWSEGILLNIIAFKLDEMQKQAEHDTGRAAQLLGTAGAELEAGAAYYLNADNKAKLAINDAKYPYEGDMPKRLDRGDVSDPGGAKNFDDTEPLNRDPRHPDRTLPPGPYPIPEPTEQDAAGAGWPVGLEEAVTRLTGAGSMAGHIRDFITWLLGGIDPFAEVMRFVSGDWNAVLRQGMAVQNLGQVGNWLADNVDRARYGIQDVWDGNAANAAEAWLGQYSGAARVLAEWGQQTGDRLQSFANAAYHAFEAMDGYLNLMIDITLDVITMGGASIIGAEIGAARSEAWSNIMDAVTSLFLSWRYIGVAIDSVIARAHEFVGVSTNHYAGSQPVTAPPWPPELGGFNREEF